MDKIPWIEYLAVNNLNGVNIVLEKYGLLRAYNPDQAIEAIGMLLEQYGEPVIIDLLKQHPDYEFIIEDYKQSLPPEPIKEIQPNPIVQNIEPFKVSNSSDNNFYDTLKDVLLIIGTIWLVKTIISKD